MQIPQKAMTTEKESYITVTQTAMSAWPEYVGTRYTSLIANGSTPLLLPVLVIWAPQYGKRTIDMNNMTDRTSRDCVTR
jgi:hypothetical protein